MKCVLEIEPNEYQTHSFLGGLSGFIYAFAWIANRGGSIVFPCGVVAVAG